MILWPMNEPSDDANECPRCGEPDRMCRCAACEECGGTHASMSEADDCRDQAQAALDETQTDGADIADTLRPSALEAAS